MYSYIVGKVTFIFKDHIVLENNTALNQDKI